MLGQRLVDRRSHLRKLGELEDRPRVVVDHDDAARAIHDEDPATHPLDQPAVEVRGFRREGGRRGGVSRRRVVEDQRSFQAFNPVSE
jgi:hypothetical protein